MEITLSIHDPTMKDTSKHGFIKISTHTIYIVYYEVSQMGW